MTAALARGSRLAEWIRLRTPSSSGIETSKRIMLERLALVPGESVLDVGCGPGDDVFGMMPIVGEHGNVVGCESSEVMIAAAKRRASAVRGTATFVLADADARTWWNQLRGANERRELFVSFTSFIVAGTKG